MGKEPPNKTFRFRQKGGAEMEPRVGAIARQIFGWHVLFFRFHGSFVDFFKEKREWNEQLWFLRDLLRGIGTLESFQVAPQNLLVFARETQKEGYWYAWIAFPKTIFPWT